MNAASYLRDWISIFRAFSCQIADNFPVIALRQVVVRLAGCLLVEIWVRFVA